MKWIKHMTNANKDDKLVSIRANFGMWGIGCYWTIVELVAEQITEKSDRAEATLIVSELLGLFGCKRNKLDSFLKHSENVSLMKTIVDGNTIRVDIPKILDFADNYIKYAGKSLKSLQRQNKVSSKQDKKRIEENRLEETSIYDFDTVWKLYPDKSGKKISETHFRTSVKTEQDFVDIQTALRNYLQSKRVQDGYIQNGSTWFNNWKDWITPTDFMMKGQTNGTNKQSNKPTSTTDRATFHHTEQDAKRFEELNESFTERIRERDKRA